MWCAVRVAKGQCQRLFIGFLAVRQLNGQCRRAAIRPGRFFVIFVAIIRCVGSGCNDANKIANIGSARTEIQDAAIYRVNPRNIFAIFEAQFGLLIFAAVLGIGLAETVNCVVEAAIGIKDADNRVFKSHPTVSAAQIGLAVVLEYKIAVNGRQI